MYEKHRDTVDNICEYYKEEAKLNKNEKKIVKKTNKKSVKAKRNKKLTDDKKQDEEEINNDNRHQNHLHNLFSKVINKLKFNIDFGNNEIDKLIYYKANVFEDAIENINITKEEIQSLKTRGKADDKYNILKIVMSRFGIKLTKKYENVSKKGTKSNVLIGYNIQYGKDIYDILRCKIHFEKKKFDKKFGLFVDNFKTYDDYLDKDSVKYFVNLPKLFR